MVRYGTVFKLGRGNIPKVQYDENLWINFTDAELARLDYIIQHRKIVDGYIEGEYSDGTPYRIMDRKPGVTKWRR